MNMDIEDMMGDEMMDGGYIEDGSMYPELEVADPTILNFFQFFYMSLESEEDNKVDMFLSVYEEFNVMTENFYPKSRWPEADAVDQYMEEGRHKFIFLTLYKELYYRHVYAKLKPTMEDRFASYENYCNLFNYILNDDEATELELPHVWLWDIIDEFIYQFQSFSQCLTKPMDQDDTDVYKAMDSQKWNVHIVLNVLHSLIEKSNINAQLRAYKEGGDITHADAVAGDFGCYTLYKMLGYFSLIGLCRMHCLLGDYCEALNVLENVELSRKTVSGVPACQITSYYYVGFSYMMLGRYQDAIRTFANVLQYIQRSKQYNRSYQYDQILKRSEQMFQLLAIAVTLQPQRIDEHLHSSLKENYGEKLAKLQKGDMETFAEMFKFSCPKFVNPVVPAEGDIIVSPFEVQNELYFGKVKQQVLLITLKSYLKLYTTMPISKLAQFLKTDEETTRTNLLNYKHKSQTLVWKDGAPISGVPVSKSDVDFYMNGDMIHVAATKVERRYGQYFLRQIGKFNQINENIVKIQ